MADSLIQELQFMDHEEEAFGLKFQKEGYAILAVEDRTLLDEIQRKIADLAADFLSVEAPENPQKFLDEIHEVVSLDQLNGLRLHVINGLRATPWFRPAYYRLVKSALASLVGNELAMQKGVGLSVQIPEDTSSLLPIHADVWDGDSSYEVVVWLPLVDCFDTKSMYLMPMEKDRKIQERLADFQSGSAEDLYLAIERDVEFLKVDYGQVLIFSQTLMHGNRLNTEVTTRWSMNCRFKSLFAPYADKKLGEFFEPITMKAASRVGADYVLPSGFEE